MNIAGDLLSQARILAKAGAKRPKQADLRRAISTAYYSLFHHLCEEVTKEFFGVSAADQKFRALAKRSIAHTKIKVVLEQFRRREPAGILVPFWNLKRDPWGIVPNQDLDRLRRIFWKLQEMRHEADYDFSRGFSRQDALDACDEAKQGIEACDRLKQNDPQIMKLLSMCILLWSGLASR